MSPSRKAALLGSALMLASGGAALAEEPVSISFHLSNFSHPLRITNGYWAMAVGRHVVYYESEEGECFVNDWIVTSKTKSGFQGIYAGLVARVVSDNVWADDDCDGGRDRLAEYTHDWYAQDNAANIWYVGEDTTAFEYDDAGNRIGSDTEGSWEAGRRGARAGLIMLAKSKPGQTYQQEFEAGVAEDNARTEAVGVPVTVGHNRFLGCLVTRESTPLAPGDIEYKFYCPNVGLVRVVGAADNHGAGAEVVDLDLP